MYKDKKFTSDLVNSYAWDTAIVFIQEFSGDIDYSKQFSIQATFAKAGEATDGRNKDVRCNIYDMAGNAYEWTTETSWYSGHSIVGRSGYFGDNSCTTSFRGSSVPNTSFSDTSFRCVLYI